MGSWNSSLTRRTPLRAKKPWDRGGKKDAKASTKKPKPMKRVGKRTAAWDALRAKMKVEFERAGIMSCELGFMECWRDKSLSFAHSKKRRNISGAELEECCLACIPCHDRIEGMPEAKMTIIVRDVIAGRETPVRSVWQG